MKDSTENNETTPTEMTELIQNKIIYLQNKTNFLVCSIC